VLTLLTPCTTGGEPGRGRSQPGETARLLGKVRRDDYPGSGVLSKVTKMLKRLAR
jgi:hypothetical protein